MTLANHNTRPAFTLIELMVSIALIVFLMLGINQVFKLSSDAVATGQQVSANNRDSRAAAAILENDGRAWLKDSPIFYIRNETDPSGNRRDYMAFFARGSYHRQTGNPGSFTSPLTSNEAFIWFGCCGGAATRRNIVGRVAVLLKDPAAIAQDIYIARDANAPLSPLAEDSLAVDPRQTPPAASPGSIEMSRYDLAGTTIDQFRKDVNQLVAGLQSTSGKVDGFDSTWWNRMAYPFNADPAFNGPPSEKAAYAAPIFLENVSQLIIEYTGDFTTQDSTGKITALAPDGTPDFVVDAVTGGHKTRWYGLPRKDDATVDALAHLWNGAAPFERELTATRYTALWVNSAPAMARILMKVEDPSGRLQEGTWYEVIMGPK